MRNIFILLFLTSSFFAQGQDSLSGKASVEYWRDVVDEFSENQEKVKGEEQTQNYEHKIETLLKSGRQRAQYLQDHYNKQGRFFYRLESSLFEDIRREIKILPLKWFGILKLNKARMTNKLQSGFLGKAEFVFEIFKLLGLIVIPFILYLLTKRLTHYLKQKRILLIREMYRGKNNALLADSLKVLIAYGPWLISLIGVYVSAEILSTSEYFSDLSSLVIILKYYILYRIFTKLLSDALLKISGTKVNKDNELGEKQTKARVHAARIAFVLMFSKGFIELIGTAVNKGIIYYIISDLSFWVMAALIFFTASRWKESIRTNLIDYQLPFISTWFPETLKGWTSIFFALPGLVLSIGLNILYVCWRWAERFDVIKKITAKLFKKKLEDSEAFEEVQLEKIPHDYRDTFLQHKDSEKSSVLIEPQDNQVPVILKHIEDWRDDLKEENSLALIGESGTGKTTLFNILEEKIEGVKVVKTSMNKRLKTKSEVFGFIGDLLGIEMSESLLPLLSTEKDLEKTVILLDEAQNSFLSKLGGFEAYKALLEISNARIENVFFCFSFNLFSWNYLTCAFRKSNTFRYNIVLKGFTEKDIKNLIMKRHDQLDYKLSYSNILKATGGDYSSESKSAIVEQFFRLLWEQSLGNPKVSMYLWLSSLKYSGGKVFRPGLPHDDDLGKLNSLGDDSLFVYSAIVKHENLSVKELKEITSLSEGNVRYALRFGLDNSFLIRKNNERVYSLNVRYQNSVINYLKKKNLVYASK